jgi:hypothetical protein
MHVLQLNTLFHHFLCCCFAQVALLWDEPSENKKTKRLIFTILHALSMCQWRIGDRGDYEESLNMLDRTIFSLHDSLFRNFPGCQTFFFGASRPRDATVRSAIRSGPEPDRTGPKVRLGPGSGSALVWIFGSGQVRGSPGAGFVMNPVRTGPDLDPYRCQ